MAPPWLFSMPSAWLRYIAGLFQDRCRDALRTPHRLSRRRRRWVPWLLGLVLAIALVETVALLDPSPAVSPLLFWSAPLKPVLNALPFLLLAVLLAAWTRRMLLSCWLAWLLAALVYGANALKMTNLATPLMPADFRMLGQLEGGGGHLLAGYLPHTPWLWLALVAGVALTALLIWREPPLLPRHWWIRTASGGAVTAPAGHPHDGRAGLEHGVSPQPRPAAVVGRQHGAQHRHDIDAQPVQSALQQRAAEAGCRQRQAAD